MRVHQGCGVWRRHPNWDTRLAPARPSHRWSPGRRLFVAGWSDGLWIVIGSLVGCCAWPEDVHGPHIIARSYQWEVSLLVRLVSGAQQVRSPCVHCHVCRSLARPRVLALNALEKPGNEFYNFSISCTDWYLLFYLWNYVIIKYNLLS